MADKLCLTLKFPFKSAAGVQLETLPIKRVKRKDISACQALTKDESVLEDMIIAKIFNLTLEDLGELDIADSKSATEVLREMSNGRDLAEVLGRSTVDGAKDAAIGDSRT
ncbi:phage tail assembly protein [Pseudomonas sp. 18175]|uniref:phage tail assembly protein n=1 Tax=Pseudomonas sp. 18175 TaxID=3390056 RepID=UPI003D1E3F9E